MKYDMNMVRNTLADTLKELEDGTESGVFLKKEEIIPFRTMLMKEGYFTIVPKYEYEYHTFNKRCHVHPESLLRKEKAQDVIDSIRNFLLKMYYVHSDIKIIDSNEIPYCIHTILLQGTENILRRDEYERYFSKKIKEAIEAGNVILYPNCNTYIVQKEDELSFPEISDAENASVDSPVEQMTYSDWKACFIFGVIIACIAILLLCA